MGALVTAFVLRFVSKLIFRRFDKNRMRPIRRATRLLIWIVAFGIGIQWLPESMRQSPFLIHGPKIGLILGVVILLDRILGVVLRTAQLPEVFTQNARSLLFTILRLVLYCLSLLICLDTLGISITPILASLGVGSLAVALALQDTLNNFFSGIYILIDEPVRVGDYVKLQDGVEGYVQRIGWRSTHLLLSSKNIVVVPNSKISAAILINYDLPDSTAALMVPVLISYANDLQKVEKIARQVAESISKSHSAIVADSSPGVQFAAMGVANFMNIELQVSFRVKRLEDSGAVRHELIKNLHAEFQKQQVVPFTSA